MIRVHEARTGEERAVVATANAASGCRAVSIRATGQPHVIAIATTPETRWRIAVVGQ